jgi:glycosyltransferase involved in cell wall biosynthesis
LPPKKYRSILSGLTVVCVGRLIEDKGYQYLLSIFSKLVKELDGLKLVVLGLGPEENTLYEICQNLGLMINYSESEFNPKANVFFAGFQENPYAFLSRATVFAMPSLREGHPVAMLEALASGACVVASDCQSGPREILSPNGDLLDNSQSIIGTTPFLGVDFARFGVLIPSFEKKVQYTRQSKLIAQWLAVLSYVILNRKVREHYQGLAIEGAQPYSIDEIVEEWDEVLVS